MIKIHSDMEALTPTSKHILGLLLGFVFLTIRSFFGVHRVVKDICKPVKSCLDDLEPFFRVESNE